MQQAVSSAELSLVPIAAAATERDVRAHPVGPGCCDSDFALARLTSAGALDSSFDGDGQVVTDFLPGADNGHDDHGTLGPIVGRQNSQRRRDREAKEWLARQGGQEVHVPGGVLSDHTVRARESL